MLIFTWGFMETFRDHIPMTFSYDPKHAAALGSRYRGESGINNTCTYFGLLFVRKQSDSGEFKRVLVDSQILEKENINARFLASKNQISPHFLFNNLSVLASLVESHPEKSGEFINQLSMAYRYILQQVELRQISLTKRFPNKVDLSKTH
ncbi:hypothetical protein Dfri01_39470 [Dyadobacter frigoris]|nr:hypothetical protein Dfri01_39470 [Dyadobacter frigoris]